jgi:hypothetical protein
VVTVNETPALPHTDDPFELLGVEPPLGELDLRRAYVRLIKRFRPERAPEEFKRIQRAYELAQTRLHWSIYEIPESADDEARGPSEVERQAETGEERARISSPEEVVPALVDRRPVPGDVFENLSPDLVLDIAGHPALGWAALRDQPERWGALELFSLRLQTLLMDGEIDRALDEIGDAAVRRDLLEVPALEHVVSRALVGCAWSASSRADDLYAAMAEPATSDGLAPDLFREIRDLAPVWRELHQEHECPPLRRFVELFPSVGHGYRQQLLEDLAGALSHQRLEIVHALDRMQRANPRLLAYMHQITDGMVYGEDLAYDNLERREQEYIAYAMLRVERQLRPGESQGSATLRWWLYGMLALGGWMVIGGVGGMIIAAAGFAGVSVYESVSQLRRSQRAARERVADAVVETGLSPDRMLEWSAHAGGREAESFGFVRGIAGDLALHTLARLARIARMWSREPAGYGFPA